MTQALAKEQYHQPKALLFIWLAVAAAFVWCSLER